MRLTQPQQTAVYQTIASIIGPDTRVWLFGSRCDDNVRGGDLDLLVENVVLPTILQRARVKLALESTLGMPVDIIGIKRGMPPNAFQRIALATGIPLEGE